MTAPTGELVAVVGSANVDLIVDVPRRPGGGETLLGGDLVTLPGGKGANQAVAAALAGGTVSFIGCVGSDDHGAMLRSSLASAGVDTVAVSTVEEATGTAIIVVTPDGENSIVVSPGANRMLTVERVLSTETHWAHAVVVVLSLEIPLVTVEAVARRAHERGSRIVLNAAPALALEREILMRADPLIVNEHEARTILGEETESSFELLGRDLLAAGARSVVVTLGSDGALIFDGESRECVRIPAFDVEPVDTTGAGDAFVGAVAAELARGASLPEASLFASAMAALSVGSVGAQSSYPDRASVEAFLARNS